MVSSAWRSLADECARWQDAGRGVKFWWRDDDAGQPTPALLRLLALEGATRIPVALAVVPEAAEAALFGDLDPRICVLQHGVDHRNRAAAGEKKTEFPAAEPVESALARLARARERLDALAGGRSLGVLVPPWNRMSERLVPRLSSIGFCGVSRFGALDALDAAPGLPQFNTHADIIAWHAGRGFAGEEAVLGQAVRRLEECRAQAPGARRALGWLTHHACHDEAAWAFLEQLFDFTRALPGVRWVAARELFGARPGA